MSCTCGQTDVTAEVQEEAIGYVAVKKCMNCDDVIERIILGSSSKYEQYNEEELLDKFN